MKAIAAYAIAVLVVLGCGFGMGWFAKGSHVAKGQVVAANAATTTVVHGVQAQIAAQQAQIGQQLSDSTALAAQQAAIRRGAGNLRLEITYAGFTPAPDAGSCPDPVGSVDFEQLYNRAAHGGAGPATATSAAAH